MGKIGERVRGLTPRQVQILRETTDMVPGSPILLIGDINLPMYPDRSTLAHLACFQQHHNMVGHLIEDFPEVDWNMVNRHGETPLSILVSCGNIALVRRLLGVASLDLNVPRHELTKPVLVEAAQRHPDIGKLLAADRRADPNVADPHGQTALFHCRDPEMMRALLDRPELVLRVRRETPRCLLCHWISTNSPLLQEEDLVLRVVFHRGTNLSSALQRCVMHKNLRVMRLILAHPLATTGERLLLPEIFLPGFTASPARHRHEIRREHQEVFGAWAADVFSLIIFHCDGLLTLEGAGNQE
jgi:hypothetical protein